MMYLDQHYLVSTSARIPSNEVHLVRVSDENESWAMSIDQAKRVGRALINAAEAMEILEACPAPVAEAGQQAR